MGQDDDADCVEHVWVVDEVHVTGTGAETAWVCSRCGASRYDGSQAARRPPLGFGGREAT